MSSVHKAGADTVGPLGKLEVLVERDVLGVAAIRELRLDGAECLELAGARLVELEGKTARTDIKSNNHKEDGRKKCRQFPCFMGF